MGHDAVCPGDASTLLLFFNAMFILSFVIYHIWQSYQKGKKKETPIGKFDFSFFFLFGVRGVCLKTHTPLTDAL